MAPVGTVTGGEGVSSRGFGGEEQAIVDRAGEILRLGRGVGAKRLAIASVRGDDGTDGSRARGDSGNQGGIERT